MIEIIKMRLFLLSLIVFTASCGQTKSPPVSNEEKQKRVAEAQTQEVLTALGAKPAWLFTGDACPADVMPEAETEIAYMGEGCADDPDECLRKCEAEDGTACYALALLLEEKHGLGKPEILPLYLRACRFGIASGCTNYAASKTNFEKMDEATTACTLNSFERTCARDDAWGCNMYGQFLALGLGREKDEAKALETFQKVCNITGADSEACVEARELEDLIRRGQNAETNESNANSNNLNLRNNKP